MTVTVQDAIRSLKAGASYVMVDDKITKWEGPGTQPTDSEVAAEKAKLETEYTNNKYQRDREIQYPRLEEQLDLLYWDKKNGTNKWVEAIDKVKSDNPKP